MARYMAGSRLGNGLYDAKHYEDALSVREAELAVLRRMEGPGKEYNVLIAQGNLAFTYAALGKHEKAQSMERDVYSGRMRLHGEEHFETLRAALNYASSCINLQRFEEGKALLRRTLPVARRVLGDSNQTTLMTRWNYAVALYKDDAATLEDLRESVTTLEELASTARRVLGGANPLVGEIETSRRVSRAVLARRDVESLRELVGAMGTA